MEDLLIVHDEVILRTGGDRGVLQPGSVDAAVHRARWGPFEHGGTLPERVALLVRGIAQDHPLADGNKRTSLAAIDLVAAKNDLRVHATFLDLVEFALQVARGIHDIDGIRNWLEVRLRKV